MSSKLDEFPTEIIEKIVEFLNLDDIRKLRLCNKILAAKATQNHFKSFFHTKHVELEESALLEFAWITEFGRPGCQIQHLTLSGVVNDTAVLQAKVKKEKKSIGRKLTQDYRDLDTLKHRNETHQRLLKSGTIVNLLSQIFNNIRQIGYMKKLLSLDLNVVVYQKDSEEKSEPVDVADWRTTWRCTRDTFHMTISSLAVSGLPIENLNIFNSRELQSCSLDCEEFAHVDLENEGLINSLKYLKSLSVSFSCRIDPKDYNDPNVSWKDTYTYLGNFLQLCIQLEDLKLHKYSIEYFTLAGAPNARKMLDCFIEMDIFPATFKSLELRGISLLEGGLINFIRETKISKLALYKVTLAGSKFRPVFDYITSDHASIEELYLESIQDSTDAIIVFDEVETQRATEIWPDYEIEKLRRVGTEVKRPIFYHGIFGYADSPEGRERHAYLAREYGSYYHATRFGRRILW